MEKVVEKKNSKYDKSYLPQKYGYENFKDIRFKNISGIKLEKFRSIMDKQIVLGNVLTLITGKNGTMKSSMLGLIAHPFTSNNNAEDMYGNPLKTKHSDVFKLSPEKDNTEYIYYLQAYTDKDEFISVPIRIYPRKDNEGHRLTVGDKNIKGQGNFSLNTSYLNLSRLFPIIETEADKVNIEFSEDDKVKISQAYQRIMQRSAYKDSEAISDKKNKNTLAPANAYYDFNSISSGEDNLGHIICKIMAFEKYKTEEACLQGLFCIDEIESSLHPVAQSQLIDYLIEWGKKNRIQIIVTTHSLFLIKYCYSLQKLNNGERNIVINNISTKNVGNDNNYNIMHNPTYKEIYKELTYKDEIINELYKVNIICEDAIATQLLKKIIKNRKLKKSIDIISDVSGSDGCSYNGLISLAKNGAKLLSDSIIVLDPDVPDNKYKNIKFEPIERIPDSEGKLYPIEQRIVNYIYRLEGNHPIFISMNTEKDAIISSFARHGIYQENLQNSTVKHFKDWVKNHKNLYNRALTYYIKDNREIFDAFEGLIRNHVNKHRQRIGLDDII